MGCATPSKSDVVTLHSKDNAIKSSIATRSSVQKNQSGAENTALHDAKKSQSKLRSHNKSEANKNKQETLDHTLVENTDSDV
jgi:hypothetical protein